MALTKKNYKTRLVDEKIEKYLKIFGSILIEGPKWCGKTWTSLNHANSVSYVTDKDVKFLAETNPKYIFDNNRPQLIDEWQTVPSIWDAVRNECDMDNKKGKFILTGSTSLTDEEENKVEHSGTGRIVTIKMYPMSLYESGDSTGEVSITDMLNDSVKCQRTKKVELDYLAKLIIRGGWPENINSKDEDIGIIPKAYIDSVIERDLKNRKNRNAIKMRMLLRSLARNESSIVGYDTIVADIDENENSDNLLESRATVKEYLKDLDELHLVPLQEAYSLNYRSSKRIGTSPKRHLVDPSLSCACLDLSVEKLMKDFNTFGFMFEALVERDLRIYVEQLDGHLFHFRDSSSGDEVDAILEFRNGDYAAIEIKLTNQNIDKGIESLTKFYNNVSKKPKFMCVIVGYCEVIMKDENTGIYIIPITSLKP